MLHNLHCYYINYFFNLIFRYPSSCRYVFTSAGFQFALISPPWTHLCKFTQAHILCYSTKHTKRYLQDLLVPQTYLFVCPGGHSLGSEASTCFRLCVVLLLDLARILYILPIFTLMRSSIHAEQSSDIGSHQRLTPVDALDLIHQYYIQPDTYLTYAPLLEL